MIDTVLFDFFGTLVRYNPSRTTQKFTRTFKFVRENIIALEYHGFIQDWDNAFCELEHQSRENHVEFSMQEVVSNFANKLRVPPLQNGASEALIEIYLNEWSSDIQPVPGLEELLANLARRHKLGVVSNTHQTGFVPSLLNKFGLANYFQEVVASIDHGNQSLTSQYTVQLFRLWGRSRVAPCSSGTLTNAII